MNSQRTGIFSAIAAFFLWGVLPVFWKQLDFMPPASIIAHRTLWSLALLLGILWLRRQTGAVLRGVSTPRACGWHLLSGALLAANWLLYVWATLNDRILEGALGYYLNPFLNMLFGVLWFGEKHNRAQRVAILLALCGVAAQVPAVKGFPWVAVVLAVTFSLYAVVKKRSPLPSVHGLTVETMLLAPFAVGWLWIHSAGMGEAFGGSWPHALLLVASGLATTLPLVLFGHAARIIPLTTLGILQFIGPTIQFVIGWKLYDEPMSAIRLLSFAMIWTAIAIYGADAMRRERQTKRRLIDN